MSLIYRIRRFQFFSISVLIFIAFGVSWNVWLCYKVIDNQQIEIRELRKQNQKLKLLTLQVADITGRNK